MAPSSFGKKRARSLALIDIGSSSVGGAYVHYEKGERPVIYYTARVAVEPRTGENTRNSMLRALAHLERRLTEEGAPVLRRERGTGSVESVLVSIAAPWQKSVGTTVNLERETVENVGLSLRQAFHTDSIVCTAFGPAAYTVFRDVYPHYKDFMVLDVSGAGSDIIVVKDGLLVEIRTMVHGARDLSKGMQSDTLPNTSTEEKKWVAELSSVFESIATPHPLPHMLFLLSDDEVRVSAREALEEEAVQRHWLDGRPSIIPVTPAHLSSRVRTRGLAEGDVFLAILALYAAQNPAGSTIAHQQL